MIMMEIKYQLQLRLEIAENPNYTEHTELSFGNENKITVSRQSAYIWWDGIKFWFSFNTIGL